MGKDEIFKGWGVSKEEVCNEIGESYSEILKFISAEAELLTNLKSPYLSKMLTLTFGTLMHFINIIKQVFPDNMYKEYVKNIKENFEQVLVEIEKG